MTFWQCESLWSTSRSTVYVKCALLPDILYFIHVTRDYSIFSYNKTDEKRNFLKCIFGIGLYMFRTVFLYIVRSLALYAQL